MPGSTGPVQGPSVIRLQQDASPVKKTKMGFWRGRQSKLVESGKPLIKTAILPKPEGKSLVARKIAFVARVQNWLGDQRAKLPGNHAAINKQLQSLGFGRDEAKSLQGALVKAYGSVGNAKAASMLLGDAKAQFSESFTRNGVSPQLADRLFKTAVLSNPHDPSTAIKQLNNLKQEQSSLHHTVTALGFPEAHVSDLLNQVVKGEETDISAITQKLALVRDEKVTTAAKLSNTLRALGVDDTEVVKRILSKTAGDPDKIDAELKEFKAQKFRALESQAMEAFKSYGLTPEDALGIFNDIVSQSGNSLTKLETNLHQFYGQLYTNELKKTAIDIFTNHGLSADDAMLMLADIEKSAKGNLGTFEQQLNKMYRHLQSKFISEASNYLQKEGGYSADDAKSLSKTMFEVAGGKEAHVWAEIKSRVHGKQLSKGDVKYVEAAGVLGVPSDADVLAIRKAYLRLAKKYHPDKNDGNEAAAKMFKVVDEAYKLLQKRA